MSIGEGVMVALFVTGMVFVLLSAIYGLIRLTTGVIARLGNGEKIN